MLHNTTRLTLLQLNKGYTALVLDALFYLGFVEYQQFTAQQAIEALAQFGLNSKQVRIGLNHAIFGRNRYRKAVYTMPAPSSARKAVGGDTDNPTRDELPALAFSSLKNYRMALLKAFLERRPGYHFRQYLADLLGVCGATIYNYVQLLGIKVTPGIKSHALTDEWIAKLPTTKYQGRFWLFIQTKQKSFDAPLRLAIALTWLKRGAKVTIREQCENFYGDLAAYYG